MGVTKKKQRQTALFIVAFCLLIAGTRILFVLCSINDLHTIFPEETHHLKLSFDLQTHAQLPLAGKVRLFLTNIDKYLPPHVQFHGIILVNSVLVALLSAVIGIHYANLHLTALLFLLLVYVCWALLIDRHFGKRALTFFSLLFLFAPFSYLGSSLLLQGSHTEGCALIAIMYLLAATSFEHKYAGVIFFTLFGVFFFFYKGVVLAFAILAIPVFLSLPSWRYRAMGAGLFALSFLPMHLYHNKFGKLGLAAIEIEAKNKSIPLTRVFDFSSFNPHAWHLPPIEVSWLDIKPITSHLFPLLFLAGFVFLGGKIFFRNGLNHLRKKVLACLLLFPIVIWGVYTFSNLYLSDRYYIPLYPIVIAVTALFLARLPRKFGISLLLVLLLLYIPDSLRLIRLGDFGLSAQYSGQDYLAENINYLQSGEVEFVNWWLDNCPDNRGFRVLYRPTFISRFGVTRQSIQLQELQGDVRLFLQQNPTESEIVALGMAQAYRGRGIPDSKQALFGTAILTDDQQRKINQGIALAEKFSPAQSCPTALPSRQSN